MIKVNILLIETVTTIRNDTSVLGKQLPVPPSGEELVIPPTTTVAGCARFSSNM